MQEFNPQSLSNVLWAFASLKHHPGNALLDGSAAHAVRCVDQFTPQVVTPTNHPLPPNTRAENGVCWLCRCHEDLVPTIFRM